MNGSTRMMLALGGLIVCLAAPCGAQGKPLKVGVVNMQRAISETEEGKRAEEGLLKYKQQLEAKLNRKLKEFYQKEQELRKAWSVLKEAEKRKKAEESRKEFEALQKEYIESERDLLKRKAKEMLKIQQKAAKIIQRIAEREKYDYIFDNAAVLWAPRHVDMTNEVIRDFNAGKK